MEIRGLTALQKELLDFMWNDLDSEQELTEFLETLDPETHRDATLLIKMVIMESIDQDVAKMQQFPDAARVILDIQRR